MDTTLLERLKSDDDAALQLVFNAHYPMVCQTIRRFVNDSGRSEDLAQEVFIRFWEKRHQIHITSSLTAYLRQMAVNEALGHLRRQRFFEEVDPTLETVETNPVQGLLYEDLNAALHDGMTRLPPKCRVVFELSRFEGLSYAEIAAHTGTSIKTVENQMGKALKILRAHLKGFL
ncbi:MAG: RNA polymerase sigma factor [Haliscomenobacter sp.]